MAVYSKTVMRCDRCGLKSEHEHPLEYQDWYVISVTLAEDYHKGTKQLDICKECKESYDKWWTYGE